MSAAAASNKVSRARSLVSLLFKKHLLATNVTLSVFLSGLGDLLQQRHEGGGRSGVDLHRCAHMSLAFGLTSGLLCHHWYLRLDAALSGSGLRTVVYKVLADQLLFSPVCIAACLAASGALEGSTIDKIKTDVSDKGVRLYLAEWVIWPPAQFVNFWLLPTRFRVLFDNTVSLGYDVYTSHVKHHVPNRAKAAGVEEKN